MVERSLVATCFVRFSITFLRFSAGVKLEKEVDGAAFGAFRFTAAFLVSTGFLTAGAFAGEVLAGVFFFGGGGAFFVLTGKDFRFLLLLSFFGVGSVTASFFGVSAGLGFFAFGEAFFELLRDFFS